MVAGAGAEGAAVLVIIAAVAFWRSRMEETEFRKVCSFKWIQMSTVHIY